MQDAVLEEDVCVNDASAVDEDLAVGDRDCQVSAAEGGHGAVGERAGVSDGAVDGMVLEDAGGLFDGEVAEGGADVLECGIVGREDGEVWCRVDGRGEVCSFDGAEEGGEVRFCGCGGDVGWNGEDAVDDVDDTAGEVEVLAVC